MSSQKNNANRKAARSRSYERAQKRNEQNRVDNEIRHEANKSLVAELGIDNRIETVYRHTKFNKDTKSYDLAPRKRQVRPSKLIRAHRRAAGHKATTATTTD